MNRPIDFCPESCSRAWVYVKVSHGNLRATHNPKVYVGVIWFVFLVVQLLPNIKKTNLCCNSITLFRSITMLCGTDNILHDIFHGFHRVNVEIFCRILTVSQNNVMDLNKCCEQIYNECMQKSDWESDSLGFLTRDICRPNCVHCWVWSSCEYLKI